MKHLVIALAVLALGALERPAAAGIIGTPVDGVGGSPVAGGNVAADGTITFFIPLSGGHAGTFGVGGVGTTSTYYSGWGGAGSMDMYLAFAPTMAGKPAILHLHMVDFDLDTVNDPPDLLEAVEVFDGGGTSLAYIDEASDSEVESADNYGQELKIALGPISDPYYARLRFTAGPVKGWNTPETLLAEVYQVPEPASAAVFGMGLLGLGLAGALTRRRSKTAPSGTQIH